MPMEEFVQLAGEEFVDVKYIMNDLVDLAWGRRIHLGLDMNEKPIEGNDDKPTPIVKIPRPMSMRNYYQILQWSRFHRGKSLLCVGMGSFPLLLLFAPLFLHLLETNLLRGSEHSVIASKHVAMVMRLLSLAVLLLLPCLAASQPALQPPCTSPSSPLLCSTHAPLLLIKNGNLYTPAARGKSSILVGGGAIVSIIRDDFPIENLTGLGVKVLDAAGGYLVPGLIDIHVHVTGGGGEMGPASRTPEGTLGELLDAGITTVVGILGTDCVSRSLENLHTKVEALREQGITAYMWSGCYRVPSPTLTGSLVRDMQLIDEVVGAGEIAISDHRSSWPSTQELLGLVTDARVGGMLSGKAGVVQFHTGSADSMLEPLWDVLRASRGAIPMKHMLPTHVSGRGPALLKAAEVWVSKGGRVDFTADQEGESMSFNALMDWGKRAGNAHLQSISLSSDAFGSLPKFNAKGELIAYEIASPKGNLNTIKRLVQQGKWELEDALNLSTINPATSLGFKKKGKLEVGGDADIVILSAESLEVEYVIAGGKVLKSPENSFCECLGNSCEAQI